MSDKTGDKAQKRAATEEEIKAMPQIIFIRYCMTRLGMLTERGDFDMVRASKFWGIRYELFCAFASGEAPLLKREREKMKKSMDLYTMDRSYHQRDKLSESDRQNQRVGRYLRKLRERLFLVGVEGISKNQAQIAALMDVSVGAVQAWEYGRTRIPDARMRQYLQIVGADLDQARIAWTKLGVMPEEIQEGLGAEDQEVIELWNKLISRCEALKAPVAYEITPDKPAFISYKQEQRWLEENGATPEQIEQAKLAPKPRKE